MNTTLRPLLLSTPALRHAAPALEPALDAAFQSLLLGGDGAQAAVHGLTAFLQRPEGVKLASQSAVKLLGGLDGLLKSGTAASAYGQLLSRAADPKTHRALAALLGKLGKDGDVLSKAATGVLKAFSKGGFAGALTKALKLSPKVLAIAGKAANALPVAGLVLSLALSGKTLLDRTASPAQKSAAMISLISGIVGTALPGSGVVTSVVDIGAGLLADGFDAAAARRS